MGFGGVREELQWSAGVWRPPAGGRLYGVGECVARGAWGDGEGGTGGVTRQRLAGAPSCARLCIHGRFMMLLDGGGCEGGDVRSSFTAHRRRCVCVGVGRGMGEFTAGSQRTASEAGCSHLFHSALPACGGEAVCSQHTSESGLRRAFAATAEKSGRMTSIRSRFCTSRVIAAP